MKSSQSLPKATGSQNAETRTLAEQILTQFDGDLSGAKLLKYIRRLCEREAEKGAQLPYRMTIESGMDAAERVKDLCDEIIGDYESSKDDPENDVSGYKPTDDMGEFIGMTSENITEARAIIAIGERLA